MRRGDVASAADTDDAQVLLLAVFLLLIPLLLMVVNGKEWKKDRVINHSEGFLCLRIFSPHRRQFHSIEDGDILGMWRTTWRGPGPMNRFIFTIAISGGL